MKMGLVVTVSAICEPWDFHRFHEPTLPAKSAVGVATKSYVFVEAPNLIQTPNLFPVDAFLKMDGLMIQSEEDV